MTSEKPVQSVRFMAVGDMMFCCELGEKLKSLDDYQYPFTEVKDYLSRADLLYGNLETMITVENKPMPFAGEGIYCAAPQVAGALADAGFHVVNLAHNHLYDFGPEGVNATERELAENNILFHGVGTSRTEAAEPLVIQRGDIRLGLLSFCSASTVIDERNEYMACPISKDTLAEAIGSVRGDVDFVVVSLHEGSCKYPSPQFRELCKAAVDCGADIVLGHHPHVINGLEEYQGKLIAYSLGDFLATFPKKAEMHSFILDMKLSPGGGVEYETVPVFMNGNLQLEIAAGERKTQILAEIDELSGKLADGSSDREYWRSISGSYLGLLFRDTMRGIKGEGPKAIVRKLKKMRLHHVKLIFRSLARKLMPGRR